MLVQSPRVLDQGSPSVTEGQHAKVPCHERTYDSGTGTAHLESVLSDSLCFKVEWCILIHDIIYIWNHT